MGPSKCRKSEPVILHVFFLHDSLHSGSLSLTYMPYADLVLCSVAIHRNTHSGTDTSMDIVLDLASCDSTALDQACIAAGGKLITIQAADLTCTAEGVEVTVSIKEYTDCGGMSCPDVFDPTDVQPELIKELENQNGVTCEMTPPGDDSTSGSARVMSWTIFGVASALVAANLSSMML